MTQFMGYDNGEYENRNYAIYNISKSKKTKEDFWDNENDCYDIWAFMDYLEENDCILSCDEVVDCLNEQQATISKLEEEKGYWKSKAMTLLMQVRRLTSRMTDEEVKEFSNELEECVSE